MTFCLEDEFMDIIQKARQGLGLSISEVSERSGLDSNDIEDLESGSHRPSEEEIMRLAPSLGLEGVKLHPIAEQTWSPDPLPARLIPAVIPLNGWIRGYEVHGYLCYDGDSREAALIDTAYDPGLALAAIEEHGLVLKAILLTHCHYDHIGGIDVLQKKTNAMVVVSEKELPLYRQYTPLKPDRLIESGEKIQVGPLSFSAHSTPGHTPGGITYQTDSLVFTGDALFAGSTGRSMSPEGYGKLLASIQEKILSLPDQTYLFPGHGPTTTVGEEKRHNPFFP